MCESEDDTEYNYILTLLKKCGNDYNVAILGYKSLNPVSKTLRDEVKREHGFKCAVCDFSVSCLLEVHHLIPKNVRGKNVESNLIPVRPTCHMVMHKIENGEKSKEVENFIKTSPYNSKILNYTSHLNVLYEDLKC